MILLIYIVGIIIWLVLARYNKWFYIHVYSNFVSTNRFICSSLIWPIMIILLILERFEYSVSLVGKRLYKLYDNKSKFIKKYEDFLDGPE